MIMKNEALRTEIIKFWTAYKPLIVQKEKTKTTLPIPSQNKTRQNICITEKYITKGRSSFIGKAILRTVCTQILLCKGKKIGHWK